MIYKVPLIIVSLLALSGSPANTKVVSEKDQQTTRSAWAKAVSLAKERNAGHTCDAEAYQSTILSQLEVAVKLSLSPERGSQRHLGFGQSSSTGVGGKPYALRPNWKNEYA